MSNKTTTWTELGHRHRLNCSFVFPHHAQCSVSGGRAESLESESYEQPVEVVTCTDQRDDHSGSESGVNGSDEYGADDKSGFNMVMPTRVGRERVLTSRMRDLLQSRWRYIYPTESIALNSLCASVYKQSLGMGFEII